MVFYWVGMWFFCSLWIFGGLNFRVECKGGIEVEGEGIEFVFF